MTLREFLYFHKATIYVDETDNSFALKVGDKTNHQFVLNVDLFEVLNQKILFRNIQLYILEKDKLLAKLYCPE